MRISLVLLGLLAACTDPTESDAPVDTVDPDVNSWSPASFPPAEVSNVVFMGDSITFGFGVRDGNNAYRSLLEDNNDNRWPTFSKADVSDRYANATFTNASRNGAETPDLLQSQLPDLQSQTWTGHTVVFVTIGGNDMVGALTRGTLNRIAGDIEANIEDTVLGLKSTFPDGVSILFTNVYEPTDGEGQANSCFLGLPVTAAEPVLDDLNARTLALAQQHDFAWVDLRAHFKGHGHNYDRESIDAYDAEDPTPWMQDDCIHPNARGHHEIRRLFLAALDNKPLEKWLP